MTDKLDKNAKIWEDVYASGHKLNYPDDAFVRLLHRFIKPTPDACVMDYGFGSGVTSLHMARIGCQVHGFEISQSACDMLNQRMADEALSAKVTRGDPNTLLPFDDNQFDFIVAWNSLTYNTEKSFAAVLAEFDRILKPSGKMIGAMSAPGDFIDQNSTLEQGIEKTIHNGVQQGAQVIIPSESDLKQRFFKDKAFQLGQLTYDFTGFDLHKNIYWLMYYQKGEA